MSKEQIKQQLQAFFNAYPEVQSFECWFPAKERPHYLPSFLSDKMSLLKLNNASIGKGGIAAPHLFLEKLQTNQEDYLSFLIEVDIKAERMKELVTNLFLVNLVSFQDKRMFLFKREDFI